MPSSKKAAPSLYVRVDIPEKYINKFKEICSEVVVEPWEFGEPEPQATVDLSKFDILYTSGLHDNLNILKKAPKIKWIHSDSAGMEAMLNEDIQNSDIIITNVKGQHVCSDCRAYNCHVIFVSERCAYNNPKSNK